MNVLVIDDSVVFRTQITACLESNNIKVVGSASNGRLGLQKLEQLSVDLITLDYEMPEMNGLEFLREMRRQGFKTKVIMFSSKSIKGAEVALDALAAGADDIVAKPTTADFDQFQSAQQAIKEILLPKILQFQTTPPIQKMPTIEVESKKSIVRKNLSLFQPKAIVIASSTGGPGCL